MNWLSSHGRQTDGPILVVIGLYHVLNTHANNYVSSRKNFRITVSPYCHGYQTTDYFKLNILFMITTIFLNKRLNDT